MRSASAALLFVLLPGCGPSPGPPDPWPPLRELGRLDGGTAEVRTPYVVLNGAAVFALEDGGVWSTDGTPEGTRRLAQVWGFLEMRWSDRRAYLAPLGRSLNQLLATDGTPRGTDFVDELRNHFLYIDAVEGDSLLFREVGGGYWRFDPGGRVERLADGDWYGQSLRHSSGHYYLTEYAHAGGSSYPVALWVSDGTAGGTHVVRGVPGGWLSEVAGRLLVLSLDTGRTEASLWTVDGEGRRIADFAGTVTIPVTTGSHAFFMVQRAVLESQELWVTDGTAAGTRRVGSFNWRGIGALVPFGNSVWFTSGGDAWVSDGTPAGTRRAGPATPNRAACGNLLFTMHGLGQTGSALHVTDASGATSAPLGTWPVPLELEEAACAAGLLYFPADDLNGLEPWRSDGTPGGTRLVADVWPGPSSSAPNGFGRYGNTVLFAARTPEGASLFATALP